MLAVALFFLVLRVVGYFALALFAADTVARAFKQLRGSRGTAFVAGAICLAGVAAAAAIYAVEIAHDAPALDHLLHL